MSQRLFVTNSTKACQPTFPWTQVDSHLTKYLYYAVFFLPFGQVAQLVERGPEKAGVGGSIPSLATIPFNHLASLTNRVKIPRAHNTRTSVASNFTFGAARSDTFHISLAVLLVLAMCCRASFA
jgi:hypothetical protein